MRKHIVAGNWKMNKTFDQADELLTEIMEKLETVTLGRNTQLIICPRYSRFSCCRAQNRTMTFEKANNERNFAFQSKIEQNSSGFLLVSSNSMVFSKLSMNFCSTTTKMAKYQSIFAFQGETEFN